MKWLALAWVAVVVLAVSAAAAFLLPRRRGVRGQPPRARPLTSQCGSATWLDPLGGRPASDGLGALMTVREQPMYWRLVEALPGEVVLTQVAFSALLTSRDRATRNTFDRKVADFVVCTQGLRVTAVAELDDASHQGREAQDAERQGLLERAGYVVLRYRHVPDAADLRAAIGKLRRESVPAMTG